MEDTLIIPNKINVGYQNRPDTYTGKLGYVIYYDQKGVLKKQKSWDGWRDHNIPNQEFINEPTNGFVLNKKVGGYKSDWNYRSEKIRIYDPRGFEFEITTNNLLFILDVYDFSKGKGIEGELIYAWNGMDLVLLPVISESYKASMVHTNRQTIKISKSDMVPGCQYTFKSGEKVIYLGKLFNHTETKGSGFYNQKFTSSYKHIFYLLDSNYHRFIVENGFTNVASKDADIISEDYANYVTEYESTMRGGKVVGYEFSDEKIYNIKVLKDERISNGKYISSLYTQTDIDYRNTFYEFSGNQDRFYQILMKPFIDKETKTLIFFDDYPDSYKANVNIIIDDSNGLSEITTEYNERLLGGDTFNNVKLKKLYFILQNGIKIPFWDYRSYYIAKRNRF